MANTLGMTPAQLTILKVDIVAKQQSGQPLFDFTQDQIATYYNTASGTSIWNALTPAKAINNAIDFSKFTPVDAVPAANTSSGNAELLQYLVRALLIQIKQMNLDKLLPKDGNVVVDATQANIRSGLRDAVIQLPAGTSGAAVTAGGSSGVTVLTACTRSANRAEALLASGTATTGSVTASLSTWEGSLYMQFVIDLLNGSLGV